MIFSDFHQLQIFFLWECETQQSALTGSAHEPNQEMGQSPGFFCRKLTRSYWISIRVQKWKVQANVQGGHLLVCCEKLNKNFLLFRVPIHNYFEFEIYMIWRWWSHLTNAISVSVLETNFLMYKFLFYSWKRNIVVNG